MSDAQKIEVREMALEDVGALVSDADWKELERFVEREAERRATENDGVFDYKDFLFAIAVMYRALGASSKFPAYWSLCMASGRNFLRDAELKKIVDEAMAKRDYGAEIIDHAGTLIWHAKRAFAAASALEKQIKEMFRDYEEE